jgi:CRP-like cAMP-binding protein
VKKIVSQIINSIHPVSNLALNEIIANADREYLPAKTIFIEKGKQNQKEYFILEGVCRSMLYSPKGDDITLSFYPEISILPPCITRTENGYSNQYFQSITDLIVLSISQIKFIELIQKYSNLSLFANKSIEYELKEKIEKEQFLHCLTAREKLINFRKNSRDSKTEYHIT